jgi:hypothetical protein
MMFDVAIVTMGNEHKTVQIEAGSQSEAYRQAKAMEGIRSVGKIKPSPRKQPEPDKRLIGHVISGPRVTIMARAGGEMPFKHLKAPPPEPPQEYRIQKKELNGNPFVLQRGHWIEKGKRRLFQVNWQKGFSEKADAQKHRNWLLTVQREAVAG